MKLTLSTALILSICAATTSAFADDAPAGAVTTNQTTTTQATSVPATTTVTSADVDESITPIGPTTEPTAKETTTLYEKRRPNKTLLGIGGGLFLGTYATTAALVAANTHSNDKSMYLPVVGPWLALKDTNYDTGKTLLYAASGALQGVGLGVAIAGFLIPEKTEVAVIQAKNVKMQVLPTSFGRESAGLGAVGTFQVEAEMTTSHLKVMLSGVAITTGLAACATTPIPADKLSRSQAAITSAETLNAQRDPQAQLHLVLAKEELAKGKKLLVNADNEEAGRVLDRAEADAIAARELARAKTSRIELEKAKHTIATEEQTTTVQTTTEGGAR